MAKRARKPKSTTLKARTSTKGLVSRKKKVAKKAALPERPIKPEENEQFLNGVHHRYDKDVADRARKEIESNKWTTYEQVMRKAIASRYKDDLEAAGSFSRMRAKR